MPESRTIDSQLLSPIWTGGVDGTSDLERTTGIVGSLRWWYEAIFRAFSHRCFDPSTHDPESPHCACDNGEAVCKACQTCGPTCFCQKPQAFHVSAQGIWAEIGGGELEQASR